VLLLCTGGEPTAPITSSKEVGQEPFATLDASMVARLEITDDNLKSVVLEKETASSKKKEKPDQQAKESWVMTSLGGFPARKSDAERAITSLKKLRISRVLTRKKKKFTGLQVSQERFARHLVLKDKAGKTLADLFIGDGDRPNAVHYRKLGGDTAFEASGIDTFDFNADTGSWVDTQFTNLTADDVVRVAFQSSAGNFVLAREAKPKKKEQPKKPTTSKPSAKKEGKKKKEPAEQQWVVKEPKKQAGTVCDQDKVKTLLSSLCSIYAANPIGKLKDPQSHGFDHPTAKVTITMKDKAETVITVGAERKKEKDFFAHRSGFDYILTLRSWTINDTLKKKLADLLPKKK